MAELKHKINLKAMQFVSARMFLNGTKTVIFYTRCYALVAVHLAVNFNRSDVFCSFF